MPIQRKIAVLDPCFIGPGLCEYLRRLHAMWKPVYCETMEEVHQSEADLAVIGQSFWEEQPQDCIRHTNWVFLDEKGTDVKTRHIQPFQPADALMQELGEVMLESGISLPVTVRKSRVEAVAVISAHGYDLQTGFALVYSLLRAQESRVLYLNFQYYCGFFDVYEKDLGDLLYLLHTTGLDESVFLKLAKTVGNLDIIPPVHVQTDLEDLSAAELSHILSEIDRIGCYDLVVFDLPVRPAFYRELYLQGAHLYSLQREGAVYDQAQHRLLADLEIEDPETSNLQIVRMPQLAGSFGIDDSIYEELMFGEMAGFIRREILKKDEGVYRADS